MTQTLEQIVNALSLGSTYALLALGLAMVYSILRVINFAHGELVTIAGYTLWALGRHGAPFALQVVGALAAAAVAAILMERIAFRPLRQASFVTLLFTSFALSIIIQNLFLSFVSPRPQGVSVPSYLNGAFHAGPLTLSTLQVITTAVAVLAFAVLTLFLRRSVQGLGMRAASEDFDTTRLMGISANRVIAAAFALAGLLAGIASVLYVARRGTVDPAMGFAPMLKALIAIVIGGFGSLAGAALGGFLLAAIEVGLDATLPASVLPFRDAFSLLIVVAILYVRPLGLLGRLQEAR